MKQIEILTEPEDPYPETQDENPHPVDGWISVDQNSPVFYNDQVKRYSSKNICGMQ